MATMKPDKTLEPWQKHKRPEGYERKFANLIEGVAKCKTDNVRNFVVAWPWVLGDTYDEIIESLSLIAEAGLTLNITGRYIHKEKN